MTGAGMISTRPAGPQAQNKPARRPAGAVNRGNGRRAAPVLLAGALGLAYVLVSSPSGDLAAHMFRAQLFAADPFGVWNNYWYAGHHIVGYSLLYPAAAALLSPQLAAAIAVTGSAALFEPLARRHFGEDAWLGALLFAAATAADLYSGRLAFAFGTLPAIAALVALDRDRPALACVLAVLSALSSPVAALFTALAGGGYALGTGTYSRAPSARRTADSEPRPRQPLAGVAVALSALAPVGVLAILFPEGGTEPFAFSAFWPILLVAAGLLVALPREAHVLRAGVALYALGTIASYLIATPVGSNVARLGTMLAAPLAALLLWRRTAAPSGWRRRAAVLAVLAPALLYIGLQAPVRDLLNAAGEPSASSAYYRPLIRFLQRQPGGAERTFRVEIPFTRFHWEAYVVASRFPLARGWERQLDIEYNALFYDGTLTASSYETWLHRDAVRFVAVPDAPLDYSALQESRLIAGGLPYLHLVLRTAHWRVYRVRDATPIAQGAAAVRALGPDWLTLDARRPGRTLVRVRFTPYWKLAAGSGCVAPAGDFTSVTLRRPGQARVEISFALGRFGARTPRCN